MRVVILLGTVLLTVLAGGCHQQPRPAAKSAFVGEHFVGRFQNVASAGQLGAPWLAAGGADGVQALYTSRSGAGALIVLAGDSVPALWVGSASASEALSLQLEHSPLYADVDQHLAYAVLPASGAAAPQLVKRDVAVADAQWQTVLTAQAPVWECDQITMVTAHPASGYIWLAGRIDGVATGEPAAPTDTQEPTQPAPPDEQAAPAEPQPGEQENTEQQPQSEEKPEDYGSVTLCRLDAQGMPAALEQTLPVRDLDSVELAPLADGRALLRVDDVIYYADPDAADQLVKIHKDEDPLEFHIFADLDEPDVAWVYYPPQAESAGTNRPDEASSPGYAVAIDTSGSELSRMVVGDVPFSQFAGEWRKRRCFLAASSSGVALADLGKQQLTWLLRQGGEVPLYVLPAARQLWAAVPDGIVGIGLDGLVALAPSLNASQALSAEQIAEVKPAAEALGWDWDATQLSPLMAQTGRLTLFDTADETASFAEFDWSLSAHHASRLLIARAPTEADLAFLEQAASPVEQYCTSVLTALGWGQAERDSTRGTQSQSELQLIYRLAPELGPPLSPGEFTLWITDQAVTMSLTAATSGFPTGIVSLEDARASAAQAVTDKLTAEGGSAGGLLIGNDVQAGWLEMASANADSLSPEQLPESVPALRLEVLVGESQLRLYVVMLDAATGQQLSVIEHGYSASVELRRANGEFAPWGAAAPAAAGNAAPPEATPPPTAAAPPQDALQPPDAVGK